MCIRDSYIPNDASSEEKRIATVAAQGNPTEALALANKAIEREKDIARLLLIRIQLSEILLQEEKVPDDFRHLVNLPIGEDALVNAIDLADRLDEIESGIKLGDRYLKDYGTHIPQAILLTARMNSKLKRYSRAEQLLLLIINVQMCIRDSLSKVRTLPGLANSKTKSELCINLLFWYHFQLSSSSFY